MLNIKKHHNLTLKYLVFFTGLLTMSCTYAQTSAPTMATSASAPAGYVTLDDYGAKAEDKLKKPNFIVVEGSTVKDTLMAWFKQEGWQKVVFELPPSFEQLEVGGSVTYTDPLNVSLQKFLKATGLVNTIAITYWIENSTVQVGLR